MNITPNERAVLSVFNHASVRFQHIACTIPGGDEQSAAARTLVKKGILAPLADGEYWLTDAGLAFVSS